MEILTLLSLFILGVSYGSTACMFSCMPFLTPLLVSNSKNFKAASKVVFSFSLGRIFTYIIISIISSSGSLIIKSILKDNTSFQILLGILTIVMSFFLFYKIFNEKKENCSTNSFMNFKPKNSFGFFMIGSLVSLNPCVPILTLITFSASATTYIEAMFYGLFFGIGAVLVPFIFYTLIVSNILRGLIEPFKEYKKYIEIFAAFMLFITGFLVVFGKINL
ncbi:MAG: sulfite exporter TauE/SafE family protein [Arcobacteraceae bacterium]